MGVIGDNILWFLGRKRWSQLRLAKELEMRPATIGDWIKGRSEPQGANLAALAQVLGVQPVDITRPRPLSARVAEPAVARWVVPDIAPVQGEAPAAFRQRRVAEFIEHMKDLGANDRELHFLRTSADSFLESAMFPGGARPGEVADKVNETMAHFLDSLLHVVLQSMERRGAKPGEAGDDPTA